MGVDIADIVNKHETNFSNLKDKVIAIDAHNILYQFLASIRQEDGTPLSDLKGNPTGHLSGLFYRTLKFLEEGLKPVYVFDGKPFKYKDFEIERRKEQRTEALEKWKEALDYESEDAKIYAQASLKLSNDMIKESQALLKSLGVPVIQAPSEGEAQAAYLARSNKAYASASQDYDSLLFGSPRLIRNLSITGKRKIPRQNRYVSVEPEEIILDEFLLSNSIKREQLILIGILVGTDFNEGIKGVGPKTALKIVKEYKTLSEVKNYIKNKYNIELDEKAEEIFYFFLNPPVIEVDELVFSPPERDKIIEILVKNHDFSEDRVSKALDNYEKILKEKNLQKRIDHWF